MLQDFRKSFLSLYHFITKDSFSYLSDVVFISVSHRLCHTPHFPAVCYVFYTHTHTYISSIWFRFPFGLLVFQALLSLTS